jgi:hypothetical protein
VYIDTKWNNKTCKKFNCTSNSVNIKLVFFIKIRVIVEFEDYFAFFVL